MFKVNKNFKTATKLEFAWTNFQLIFHFLSMLSFLAKDYMKIFLKSWTLVWNQLISLLQKWNKLLPDDICLPVTKENKNSFCSLLSDAFLFCWNSQQQEMKYLSSCLKCLVVLLSFWGFQEILYWFWKFWLFVSFFKC